MLEGCRGDMGVKDDKISPPCREKGEEESGRVSRRSVVPATRKGAARGVRGEVELEEAGAGHAGCSRIIARRESRSDDA